MNVPAPKIDYFISETIAGLRMVAAIRAGAEPEPTGGWKLAPLSANAASFVSPDSLIAMSHPDPEMIRSFRAMSGQLGFQVGFPGLDFRHIYVEKP